MLIKGIRYSVVGFLFIVPLAFKNTRKSKDVQGMTQLEFIARVSLSRTLGVRSGEHALILLLKVFCGADEGSYGTWLWLGMV